MAAQARIREKFVSVERMFDRDQARVLREGNDIIIRVTGLTFSVGKADIEPQFFGLLTTVQRAITEFPGARLSVEGHTDSFGGDQTNLELSQKRADAVREYLLANMRLEPALVDAIGYGETQPVASNETREGRTRNRRIEIIIHPELGTGSW
jgi:outer membrane protein OmpA-like peptidoglycan-associated protein